MNGQNPAPPPPPVEGSEEEGVSIGTVLGFVTEFNQNAEIFNLAAAMILATYASMQTVLETVTKHTGDISSLKTKVSSLEGQMAQLAGAVAAVQAAQASFNTYRPSLANTTPPPVNTGTPS